MESPFKRYESTAGTKVQQSLGRIREPIIGLIRNAEPIIRRIRWGRVAMAAGLVIAVPFVLFSGTASSHERQERPPHATITEHFIGPRVTVGYSPISNEERKAMAEEEIRQRKIANGEITEDEANPPIEEMAPLVLDDSRQYEGDLDFSDANRDNLIARAVRSWQRPTWASKIDWGRVQAILEEQGYQFDGTVSAQPEQEDAPDESIAGYDDIVRVSFAGDEGFSWTQPSGKTLTYDGAGKVSGDAPVCPDLDERTIISNNAVYALDREADGDGDDLITFADDNDRHQYISFADKVVPDERDGAILMVSVSGSLIHEARIDRTEHEIEVNHREAENDDRYPVDINMFLLGGEGMMTHDHVAVSIKTTTQRHIRAQVSCVGLILQTADDEGLSGIEVEMDYRFLEHEGTFKTTVDTGSSSEIVRIQDHIDGNIATTE